MNALVSIIIPTYNRGDLIGETLNSVIAQTYKNWECVVVDDGSTDNTESIINEYVKKDSRFKFFKRPENYKKGGNGARNYGLRVSLGEFVNWFDSDDLMHESLLQEKMQIFRKNDDLNLVICGFTMFQGDVAIENKKWIIKHKENLLKRYLVKDIVLNTPVILWKKNKIENILFDEDLTRAQDLDFIFRALQKISSKFEIIELPLVKVRIHEQSISNSYRLGTLTDIKSEIRVRKSIFLSEIDARDHEFKIKTRNIYLNSLKQSLIAKKYNVFFNEIMSVKSIDFKLKIKLLFIGLSYLLFKKGLSKYSTLLKLNK